MGGRRPIVAMICLLALTPIAEATLTTFEPRHRWDASASTNECDRRQAASAAVLAVAPSWLLAARETIPCDRRDVLSVRPLAQAWPDDPLFPEQYALSRVNATPAWDETLGEGAVVAVLDSGVDVAHPDLRDVDRAHVPVPLMDGAQGDACGHGTTVAGGLVAGHDNAEGITGIAPGITLLPIRVLGLEGSPCSGTSFDLAVGIVLAAQQGADVICISLSVGGEDDAASPDIAAAIAFATRRGATIVAAAGNTGGGLTSPASDPHVISVGATSRQGDLAPFSARGATIHAPGDALFTTLAGGGYGAVSGTSMAAPLVAGALAFATSLGSELSSAELRDLATTTAHQSAPGVRELDVGALVEVITSDRRAYATVHDDTTRLRGERNAW